MSLIELEIDGIFSASVIVDKKSYALKKIDGKIILKGNTLRSRSVEPFSVKFIKNCVLHILNNEKYKCKEEYFNWKFQIQEEILSPDDILVRKTLKSSIEEYQSKIAAKSCNQSAQYELALKAGKKYQKGDQILFYVSNKENTNKVFEKAKSIKEYCYDYDINYYLKRLKKTATKLATVLTLEELDNFFDIKLTKSQLKKLEERLKNAEEDIDIE